MSEYYQPQVLDPKNRIWYLDALCVINELGGQLMAGKVEGKDWVRVGQPVRNFCAANGICYSIRFACIRIPSEGWGWLKRMLNTEQYDKAREMCLMTNEEFKQKTEELVADVEKRHGKKVKEMIPNVC